jgi:hypothetical protein
MADNDRESWERDFLKLATEAWEEALLEEELTPEDLPNAICAFRARYGEKRTAEILSDLWVADEHYAEVESAPSLSRPELAVKRMGSFAFSSTRFWADWGLLLAELREARRRGDRASAEALGKSVKAALRTALSSSEDVPRRGPDPSRLKAAKEAQQIKLEIDTDRGRLANFIAELDLKPTEAEKVLRCKVGTVALLVAIVRHYRPELRGDLGQLLGAADSLRHL